MKILDGEDEAQERQDHLHVAFKLVENSGAQHNKKTSWAPSSQNLICSRRCMLYGRGSVEEGVSHVHPLPTCAQLGT